MRKLLAAFALSIVLIGVLAPVIQVEAVKEKIPYIIVQLDSVHTSKDPDEGAMPSPGEVEILSICFTGKGEPQVMTWPIKVEDSSWHDAGGDTMLSIYAPIFSIREDQIQEGLAIWVEVLDNDEAPGWVDSVISGILNALEKGASSIGGFWGYAAKGAVALAKALKDPIMEKLTDYTDMGDFEKVLIPADWNSGYLEIYQDVGDAEVTVSIRRVMVPSRTPPVSVVLKSVTGDASFRGDNDWGDGGNGEPFIHTRVMNDLTVPEDQVQKRDFDYGGEIASEGTWTINEEIFRTSRAGPFLFVEIDVWDEDDPDLLDPHDEIGIMSFTYYPEDNWGIGAQESLRWGLGEGYVNIKFEIVELPYSDPEITLEPTTLAVKPGDTGTYTVTIKNIGNMEDTFNLALKGLDSDWYAFSTTSVTLPPDVSTSVNLLVTPEKDWKTAPGDRTFNVTTTGVTDTEAFDFVIGILTVLEFHDVWVGVAPAFPDGFTAEPGDSVLYTIGVRNLGNIEDDFNVELGDLEYIKESWTDIWPLVFWNLAPGETQTGWVEIEVPKDWGRLGLETAADHFLVIATSQAEPSVQKSVWGGLTINIGERELSLDLSGQADYLWMEQVKIKLGALVKDINTDLPLSGATVNVKIYRPPDGQLWIDTAMTESEPGLYEWQSEKTIQQYIRANNWQLVKGTFIAYVEASYEGGPKTTKTVSFHLDPPAEAELPSIAHYLTTIIISIAATLALSRLLHNRGFRKPKHH